MTILFLVLVNFFFFWKALLMRICAPKDGINWQWCNECMLLLTDFNECVSSPCRNDGTCVDRPNEWSCLCEAGYAGRQCERGKHLMSKINWAVWHFFGGFFNWQRKTTFARVLAVLKIPEEGVMRCFVTSLPSEDTTYLLHARCTALKQTLLFPAEIEKSLLVFHPRFKINAGTCTW